MRLGYCIIELQQNATLYSAAVPTLLCSATSIDSTGTLLLHGYVYLKCSCLIATLLHLFEVRSPHIWDWLEMDKSALSAGAERRGLVRMQFTFDNTCGQHRKNMTSSEKAERNRPSL